MDVATTTPRRTRAITGAVIAAVAASGVLIGVAIAGDDDSSTTVDSSSLVSSVRQGCQQWLEADAAMMGDRGWCSTMAGWMAQSMSGTGMGPQMMWGDPERMRTTCAQWMASEPPAGSTIDPATWCGSMVDWMATNMRSWSGSDTWDGWMSGPMMGG